MQRVLVTLMLSWMLAGVAMAAPEPIAPDLRWSHPAEAEGVPSWAGEKLDDLLVEPSFETVGVAPIQMASTHRPMARFELHVGVGCHPR